MGNSGRGRRSGWVGLALIVVGACDDASPDAPDEGVPLGPPQAQLQAEPVEFGFADCGSDAPTSAAVALTNVGGDPLTWSAQVRFSPAFSLRGPLAGSLAAGEVVVLELEAAPLPPTATAGQLFTDVLRVETNDPALPAVELPLRLRARGAAFEISPSVADFGGVPTTADAATPPIPVSIVNVGNAAATVVLEAPEDASFQVEHAAGAAPVGVVAGGVVDGARVRFDPSGQDTTAHAGTLRVRAEGPVCAGSAAAIELRGQATAGVASVVPAMLDFGRSDCGSAPDPQRQRSFFVTNTGNRPLNFTASFAAGPDSRYQLDPPAAVVPGPGQIEVRVLDREGIPAVSAVTPDLYGDTLTVVTDAADDAPRVVPIRHTARGAILRIDQAIVDLGVVQIGDRATHSGVRVVNEGNIAVDAQVQPARGVFSFDGPALSTVLVGGEVVGSMALRAPTTIGVNTDTLEVGAEGPLCAPLPMLPARAEVTVRAAVVEVDIAQTAEARAQTLCARTAGGYVACVGSNHAGARGAGATIPVLAPNVPNLVQTRDGVLDQVAQLDAGRDFFCARRTDGMVLCWGNLSGLGTFGAALPSPYAREVVGPGVIDLVADHEFGCALVAPGGVTACWGGGGTYAGKASEWALGGAKNVSLHGAGGVALMPDRTLVSFGDNAAGERATSAAPFSAPTAIADLPDVVGVSGSRARAGGGSACAVQGDGNLRCWGRRLGHPGNSSSSTPGPVIRDPGPPPVPLHAVTTVAVGDQHACALAGGEIACWGRGAEGQLGAFDRQSREIALPVEDPLPTAVALAVSMQTSCALLSTGGVHCWGELLDGSGASTSTPVPVDAFEP